MEPILCTIRVDEVAEFMIDFDDNDEGDTVVSLNIRYKGGGELTKLQYIYDSEDEKVEKSLKMKSLYDKIKAAINYGRSLVELEI